MATRASTTRTIGPDEMNEVWALIERLGLMDPNLTQPPPNFDEIVPSPGSITYTIAVTAGRRSRAVIERVPDEPGARGGSVELVRMLARLAWATDLSDPHVVTIPRRYDFGPDPYAQYRRP